MTEEHRLTTIDPLEMMSVQECAQSCGVSVRWIRAYADAGRLLSYRKTIDPVTREVTSESVSCIEIQRMKSRGAA